MQISKYMISRDQLITLRPGDTVQRATEKMSHNGVNSVLIQKGDQIIGIVTSRDVMKIIGSRKSAGLAKTMESIMNRDLITIKSNRQTTEAILKIKDSGVHHLLVEDEKGTIVGIISSYDLVKEKALDHIAHPWIRS